MLLLFENIEVGAIIIKPFPLQCGITFHSKQAWLQHSKLNLGSLLKWYLIANIGPDNNKLHGMGAELFSFYHLASCVPHTISNNNFGNVMMFIAFNTISIIVSTHNKDITMSRGQCWRGWRLDHDEDGNSEDDSNVPEGMKMVTVVRMTAMF